MLGKNIKGCFLIGVIFLVLGTQTAVAANGTEDFGDYLVHYSTFSADTLPPQMATAYGILRSKYKGVLNISVQRKDPGGGIAKAVNGVVNVQAANLVGQAKSLTRRRIAEGKAIYYISEFGISNRENIGFTVSIVPAGATKALDLKFRQTFYTE
ncbi:MAG: hypothetical protein A6F71_04695 [Cycloclasticus sp. symbiont of Poecilosclerida sp. M]|nr:MAG: hypothetical protein A6F71_04695 [Cycloclasticus sp. symbiont of Poecilosclerida sp. M]